MKVLVFDIKSPLGHFKKPDATATHLTYPFITGTAIRGMLGSIIGLEEFTGKAFIGIQLLNPVQTVAQELSLLGKGFLASGGSFNRPTAIELVVNPHYRIYYAGDYYDEITQGIKESKSVYHTYMGSAFALTFPVFVEELDLQPNAGLDISSITVTPVAAIEKLHFHNDAGYARVGGMQYQYLGKRRFAGTINLLYEIAGKPICFQRRQNIDEDFVRLLSYKDGECICLW
ncbi:MAG: CRISPR-associated protein Cas5 [Peptococcaceae bacterium]